MDIDRLLEPLEAGDDGAGVDLREDYSASSPYQRLRDARAEARAEERARDADGDTDAPEAAGWRDVLSIGEQALEQSKDIEIAAWMTEALVRREGLAGLSDGARLIAGLCERFWDAAFPRRDEDGFDGRRSPIEGLSGGQVDGTVMQPLRMLPLFRRTDGAGFCVYQWEQAEQIEALDEEKRAARYAAGAPEMKTLLAEARMDRANIVAFGRELNVTQDAWKALEAVCDARFGDETPSLRKVRALLDRMEEVVRRLGGYEVAEEQEAETTAATGTATANAGVVAAAPTGVLTRESALRDLDRIAEYFKRTEPHSPLAYTLEEAVRRGRMSLDELLAEVVPDLDTRNSMRIRLGMRPEES